MAEFKPEPGDRDVVDGLETQDYIFFVKKRAGMQSGYDRFIEKQYDYAMAALRDCVLEGRGQYGNILCLPGVDGKIRGSFKGYHPYGGVISATQEEMDEYMGDESKFGQAVEDALYQVHVAVTGVSKVTKKR